jgi:hypothetical protein
MGFYLRRFGRVPDEYFDRLHRGVAFHNDKRREFDNSRLPEIGIAEIVAVMGFYMGGFLDFGNEVYRPAAEKKRQKDGGSKIY